MSYNRSLIVETRCGKVEGVLENGLQVFKGIPYAAPPIGELRWQPPRPPDPWSGIRPAREFGCIALQPPFQLSGPDTGLKPEPQSEDCLFLNVFTPAADDRKRPVMVWIHGGGFHMGSGSSLMHPGHVLPLRGDVVFVGINYRLGPLGFLRLKETSGGQIPSSGNEGLLDQVAALRWVKDNIAAFGGDPSNITVFGESAGAMSIGCLLAMPAARGLFQKAILQSGVSTVRSLDFARRVAAGYRERLGFRADCKEDWLAAAADNLINQAREMVGANFWSLSKGTRIEPVIDGEVLPRLPLESLAAGSAREITVLAGSTLDEATIFTMANPQLPGMSKKDLVTRLEKFLPSDFSIELIQVYNACLAARGVSEVRPFDTYQAIFTDLQFRLPAVRLVESQTRLGVKAYNYIFDWPSVLPGLKACHSLELGFLFGNYHPDFHGQGPAAARLADQIQSAWIAFARSGSPACPELGDWPEYGSRRHTMLLGADSRVVAAPYETERAAWQKAPDRWLG